MFSVRLKKQALRFLKSLDRAERQRIAQKIDALERDPRPPEASKMQGYDEPKVFRVRVGNVRILYFVDYGTSTVFIEKIDRRSTVYQR